MALAGLILFSVLFAVTHIGMSHDPLRARLVERLGPKPFMGLYSLVSFVTLGGAIWIFSGHRGLGPVLWVLPGLTYPLIYLLMLFAIFLLVFSVVNPSPTGMDTKMRPPRGVLSITRHPMNVGIGLFGLAHMVANGALGDVFFFGSLFVVGIFGAYHQDRRKAREIGESFADFEAHTSVFPFVAILKGKNKLRKEEFSLLFVAVSLLVYILVMTFHGKLFGASPF